MECCDNNNWSGKMDSDNTIKKLLDDLEEGESLVALWPAVDKESGIGKGYFIVIGDNWTEHGWAITQAELDKLHELTWKYYGGRRE